MYAFNCTTAKSPRDFSAPASPTTHRRGALLGAVREEKPNRNVGDAALDYVGLLLHIRQSHAVRYSLCGGGTEGKDLDERLGELGPMLANDLAQSPS